MNIIQAIKSGRRFRHKLWRGYDDNDWADPKILTSDLTVKLTMPVGALIADDWEVEETSCYAGSAMITREQFDAAWDKALLMIGIKRHRDALAKELGL